MAGNNLKNSKFNVADMAKAIADNNDEEVSELFAKKETHQPVEKTETIEPIRKSSEKKPWTPDASTLEGMPELTSGPVTYDKSEIKSDEEEGLKNISDDNALQASREAMNDLERKQANIEDAKRRNKIKYLHIPEGQYQVSILAAAGDTNYKRAQADIDEILEDIKNTYPEWIEFEESESNETNVSTAANTDVSETNEINHDNTSVEPKVSESISEENINDSEDVKVVIDKSQLPEVSWSEDEIDKIRKARKVQLDIVESKNIEYGQIIDVDDNAVDTVLSPYMRRSNDVVAALPASKYRCTFTGLSYPEVIDLSNSQEMNNIDGERKKWSIAYNHIKNQSIGPWEEYKYYIDPTTKKKMKMDVLADIPAHVNPDTVVFVSKFEDFLMKTSFIDLDYILWKILCATAMPEEIISIDCHAYPFGLLLPG